MIRLYILKKEKKQVITSKGHEGSSATPKPAMGWPPTPILLKEVARATPPLFFFKKKF